MFVYLPFYICNFIQEPWFIDYCTNEFVNVLEIIMKVVFEDAKFI